MPTEALIWAVIAGVLASFACGLGVVPFMIKRWDPARHRGLGYAVAGGLMFAASVYNLLLPGMDMNRDGQWQVTEVLLIIAGLLVGAGFLALVEHKMHGHDDGVEHVDDVADDVVFNGNGDAKASGAAGWGGRLGLLVLIAMTFHSIPEGVAVGVGFASDAANEAGRAAGHTILPDAASRAGSMMVMDATTHAKQPLGPTLALAIGLHNIPEGLAVAIPMRAAGVGLWRCFWAAVFTSVPQPIAAIPAVLLAWFFTPIMPFLMAFAAGAMIFLIVVELIPEALSVESASKTAWAFMFGFCGMLLVQVVL